MPAGKLDVAATAADTPAALKKDLRENMAGIVLNSVDVLKPSSI
jgi:hypothetical protein